jgi:hypothetical protein
MEIDWLEEDNHFQVPNETSGEWLPAMFNAPFEQTLQQGLETNTFSTVDAALLPVSAIDIAKAVQQSPEELFKQSFAFAIIGRNVLLVEQLYKRAFEEKIDLSDIHPYHLAATHLDGARSCCQILRVLRRTGSRLLPNVLGPAGYTVLDNLMIVILRNHSSTLPEALDDSLREAKRFGGEDIDVCGRWDADSDCYQSLLHSGSGRVPWSWKHKFCHTSTQAVCHAMISLDFNSLKCPPSGIFMKRCFTCGLKLQLPPMHTIVVTGFHLAQSGFKDEDLFGMICCVLCFSVYGRFCCDNEADRAHVSIDLLLGGDSSSLCTHEFLTAAQLAKKLASAFPSSLSKSTRRGWLAICQILQQTEDQYTWAVTGIPPAGYEEEHEEVEFDHDGTDDLGYFRAIFMSDRAQGAADCEHMDVDVPRAFGKNRLLGHIWAACQCELLTYRRLRKEEPWTSKRINVGILADCLESRSAHELPYIKERLLNAYCACGRFDQFDPSRREVACSEYFSNLDDWNRTTFLDDTMVEE